MAAPKKGVKPGQVAPTSGQYTPRGGGSEITAVKGKRMPPGQPGKDWVLVDKTKHKK